MRLVNDRLHYLERAVYLWLATVQQCLRRCRGDRHQQWSRWLLQLMVISLI